jgi:hypothetical protein
MTAAKEPHEMLIKGATATATATNDTVYIFQTQQDHIRVINRKDQ